MKAFLLQKYDYEDLIESKIFLDENKAKNFFDLKRKLGENNWEFTEVKIDESDYSNIKLKKYWEANGRGIWHENVDDIIVEEKYILESQKIPKDHVDKQNGTLCYNLDVNTFSNISAEDAKEKCIKLLNKEIKKILK